MYDIDAQINSERDSLDVGHNDNLSIYHCIDKKKMGTVGHVLKNLRLTHILYDLQRDKMRITKI